MTQVRLVEIKAADGVMLRGTLHEAAGDDALVVAPAMGVPRRYYDAFAQHAVSRGFTTLLFDYRGMGESKTSDARLEQWGSLDIAAAIDFVKPRRVHLLGHSVGGQVTRLAPNVGDVRKMVFIASQSGHWRHWTGYGRMRVLILWSIMGPVARMVGYFPMKAAGLGAEDLPKGVAQQWAEWGWNPRYVWGAGLKLHDYAGPLYAWSFAGDDLAPVRAVQAMMSEHSTARVEHRHVEDRRIGHFGFFKKELGASLWDEVLDWIRSP